MSTRFTLIAVSLLVAAAPAFAQDSLVEVQPDEGYSDHPSVLTGRTVGRDVLVLHPEVGYPGTSFTLLYGARQHFDAGGRVSLGYGTRLGFGFAPAVGAQAVLRWGFLNQGIVSLGMRMEPGAFFSIDNRGQALLLAPVGMDLGIHPHPIVNVALGFDVGVGVLVNYDGRAAFVLPLQFGPGVEVNLTDTLALTFDTRFGTGYSVPAPDYRGYGFKAAVGLAVRQ